MSELSESRFQKIVEAARERKDGSGVDTMIVSSHLAQMRLFMLRQGVEFYPKQDTYGFRKSFLTRIVEENEIDARLEGITDDFLLDGKGLWFFRPVRDSYRVMWFSKENYRAYYDAFEALEELDLIYSFTVQEPLGMAAVQAPGGRGKTKYVRLRVQRDKIIEVISDDKPSFETPLTADANGLANGALGGKKRTTKNSLGFVPAVEAFNVMRSSGMDATGDFAGLGEHVLVHDSLVRNIRENIRFYGNPTLVSSRPRHDMMESIDGEMRRPTISSQAGFASANRPSTRFELTGAPSLGSGVRVPRLISNIEPTDRVNYITPNAVSGDQNLYARQYREEIRTALGGVDELGISSGATAYEIRSLYGRAATTASRKCRGLLTYGLCKLLALMIYHEERIFRESFAAAIKLASPEPPLREGFSDDEQFNTAVMAFDQSYGAFEAKLDQRIQEAIDTREFPPNVVGLIPDGDRRVEWRWRGPVFEESTEDILNNSIVVRNLQELGVNSIEALRHLFPSKTDEERSAMLNGYPFRMVQATQQSIATFLQLVGSMGQLPHPQAPDLPLLADARLDLVPFLYRAFDFLKRELTYAGQYGDSSGSPEPTGLSPIERARADAGLPIAAPGDDGPAFVPDAPALPGRGPGAPGSASPGGQPVAGGVSAPVREPERTAALPAPGAALAADPTGGRPFGLLPFAAVQPPVGIQYGDPDLSLPGNAGLLRSIADRMADGAEPGRPAGRTAERRRGRGRRRVSERPQQRKS